MLNCHPALVPLPPLAIFAALAVPLAVFPAVAVSPLLTVADPLGRRRGQPVAGEELPEGGSPVVITGGLIVGVWEGFPRVGISVSRRPRSADLGCNSVVW